MLIQQASYVLLEGLFWEGSVFFFPFSKKFGASHVNMNHTQLTVGTKRKENCQPRLTRLTENRSRFNHERGLRVLQGSAITVITARGKTKNLEVENQSKKKETFYVIR